MSRIGWDRVEDLEELEKEDFWHPWPPLLLSCGRSGCFRTTALPCLLDSTNIR